MQDNSDRARISYVDVMMSFGVIVALVGVSPWLWNIIQSLQAAVDPLSGTLLALFIPLLFLALIISIGVSARSQ
jgi:hypothetical protein